MSKIMVLLALLFALGGMPAGAQAPRRSSTAATPITPAGRSGDVTIRKIEGLGNAGLVRTPEYQTDVTEAKAVGVAELNWAKITCRFDTEPEWTDELTFKFYVLVRHPKTNLLTLFPAEVTYTDIRKGRQHQATMFLAPATVERYGNVDGAAVEVYAGGELKGTAANPEQPAQWWRSPKLKVKEGLLLNRAQTPFALINIDSYPTVKGK